MLVTPHCHLSGIGAGNLPRDRPACAPAGIRSIPSAGSRKSKDHHSPVDCRLPAVLRSYDMAQPLPPGTSAPAFASALHAGSDRVTRRVPRPAGHSRVLPGGLEPGVRRSDGALQRDPAGVPAARRRIARHLGRRRVVPLAFAKDRKLHFPLLADFEPKGDVARRVRGVSRGGRRLRAGAVRHRRAAASSAGATCSPIGVNPGADGILRALESLAQAR